MADRIIKSDSGNDTVIQNDDASAKIEVNDNGTIVHTGTSTIDVSGGTFTTSSAQKQAIVQAGPGSGTLDVSSGTFTTSAAQKQAIIDGSSANQAGIKTALNASGNPGIFACRAFVNFNGTGTLAIRASGNVSSVTDRGEGLYTVNITTAFPDSNYTVVGMSGGSGSSQNAGVTQENINSSLPSTSAIPLNVRIRNTSADGDSAFVCIACFS